MTRRNASRRWLAPMCLVLLLGGFALPAGYVAANTLHVTDCGDTGANTLRGKIAAALAGDTIVFDQNCTITLATGTLTLTQSVTINGTGHTVSVDGNNAATVFSVNSGVTATLIALTIQHGSASILCGQSVLCGGGIYNAGALTLTNSTISSNSATHNDYGGGGIFVFSGTATVTNSTLINNSASGGFGGGIFVYNGTATVTNSTLTGNSATIGGGLANISGPVTLTNTIVANNAGGDVSGGTLGSANLIGGTPLLGTLGDYGGPTQTIPLLPGSPAIGRGTTGAGIPTTDQRGVARTGHTDIGAFQSQGFSLTKTGGDNQSQQIGIRFVAPLTLTVAANAAGAPYNEPVQGGTLIITPPAVGASATVSANPALSTNGQASITLTANGTAGGPYTVTVSAGGTVTVTFSLTNLAVPPQTTYTVGTTADHAGGLTSATTCTTAGNTTCALRDAVAYATSGTDTIVFNGTGQGTITLTNGPLTLAASVTIAGPGANLLAIDGGCTGCDPGGSPSGGVTVFVVSGGVTASLSGLTIQHGNASVPDPADANRLSGGGIANFGGGLSVTNSTLRNNATPSNGNGGAIYNSGGQVNVQSSTLSGNRAAASGAIANRFSGGVVTVTNSTITGNDGGNAGGMMTVTNTIVAGNTGGDVNGVYTGSTNLIGGTPLLGALGNYGGPTQTFPLLPGSPAIGQGDPAVCAATGVGKVNGVDQRGFLRQAGVCSIGAFEAQPVLPNLLPPSKPPGPVGGPASPLPAARPPGTTGGPAPNPLPVSRP